MFGVMYISVQSCCKSETVFVYHHTSSLLCGKILTTPTFLLLKYGFIADARLEAGEAKFTAIHVALRHLIKYSWRDRLPSSSSAWTINEPHLPYKTGLDVMQSHPLRRTRMTVVLWPRLLTFVSLARHPASCSTALPKVFSRHLQV